MSATTSKKTRKAPVHRKRKNSLKVKKAPEICAPKRNFYAASAFGIGLIGMAAVTSNAHAAVTIYTADSTNTNVSMVGLGQGTLGNSTLNNPGSLTTGSNQYKYAAVHFTAKEDGALTLGQLSSPVDSIMILYDGVFNPDTPGTGAKVGNDDTSASIHQNTLTENGFTWTNEIKCGTQTSYCPQVKWTVQKGQTYTLFVSVYNGSSYNDRFDVPFDFYATGDVIFGQYTGRTPINMSKDYHLSSALYDPVLDTGDVDPIFLGGTLQIDQADSTYTHNFTLSDMATNTIDANGNNAVFSGVFSDETNDHGVITIADSTNSGGTVTFTGNNTYTGSTTLKTGGTLFVSENANLGATAASLIFDGGTLKTTGSFNISRDISIASNGGTINIAPSTTLSHDGIITGAGDWNKEGNGTLILNGSSTNTGNININSGTLVVGSDTTLGTTAQVGGNVNVGNTATLAGHGTILGHVTANAGGKVAPGSSLGVLNTGNITFNSGSTYEVDAYPDGTSDAINASGTTTINSGSHLSVLAGAGTWNQTTTYTIIDTTGGVTSTFDSMSTNMAFLTPTQLISGNQLLLVLTRNSTAVGDVGQTDNQRGSGSGVGDLGSGHPIYDTIISMDARSANRAFDNLSGEIHASVKSAILTNSYYPRIAVNRHLETGNVNLLGNTPEADKNLWVHSWAHDGHLKSDYNAEKLKNRGFGILLGFDAFTNGNTILGVAAGYEQTDLNIGGVRDSKADLDALHLLAYGRTSIGAIDIKGGIGYSRYDVDTTRNINVGSIVSRNKANYDGEQVQIFAEGSHTFEVNEKFDLIPYAGLAYQRVHTDSFTEKVSDSTGNTHSILHQNGSSDDIVTSTMGVRSEMNVTDKANLYADLGWRHTFGETAPEANLRFTGSKGFTVHGAKIDRNAAVVGFGANIQIKPNVRLSAGYEGSFGDESRSHAGTVRLEFAF